MLDDERFLVVFNQDPPSSVSVVDLETRRFAGEIVDRGLRARLPGGPRRFGTLCGDGTALEVELDDGRAEGARRRAASAFFDPSPTR